MMLAGQVAPPLVQALVPLGLGIYATLAGFGIIPPLGNPKKAAAWKGRWASSYRIGGPLLTLAGLYMLYRALTA